MEIEKEIQEKQVKTKDSIEIEDNSQRFLVQEIYSAINFKKVENNNIDIRAQRLRGFVALASESSNDMNISILLEVCDLITPENYTYFSKTFVDILSPMQFEAVRLKLLEHECKKYNDPSKLDRFLRGNTMMNSMLREQIKLSTEMIPFIDNFEKPFRESKLILSIQYFQQQAEGMFATLASILEEFLVKFLELGVLIPGFIQRHYQQIFSYLTNILHLEESKAVALIASDFFLRVFPVIIELGIEKYVIGKQDQGTIRSALLIVIQRPLQNWFNQSAVGGTQFKKGVVNDWKTKFVEEKAVEVERRVDFIKKTIAFFKKFFSEKNMQVTPVEKDTDLNVENDKKIFLEILPKIKKRTERKLRNFQQKTIPDYFQTIVPTIIVLIKNKDEVLLHMQLTLLQKMKESGYNNGSMSVSLNQIDSKTGFSVMALAIQYDLTIDTFDSLLVVGFQLNVVMHGGNSLLHVANKYFDAEMKNTLEIIAWLYQHGVDFFATNKMGMLALQEAVIAGNFMVAKAIIEAVVNEEDKQNLVNVQDTFGRSLLHLVFDKSNWKTSYQQKEIVDFVAFLIDEGIDVNFVDNNGNTVLHYLAVMATPMVITLVDLFIQAGADHKKVNQEGKHCVDVTNCQENFAIQVAKSVSKKLNEISGMDNANITLQLESSPLDKKKSFHLEQLNISGDDTKESNILSNRRSTVSNSSNTENNNSKQRSSSTSNSSAKSITLGLSRTKKRNSLLPKMKEEKDDNNELSSTSSSINRTLTFGKTQQETTK